MVIGGKCHDSANIPPRNDT